MNVLLIEDEEPASTRLKKLLASVSPELTVLETLVSVKSAIEWLTHHYHPDLIIMDIQLSDGISFDIFNEVEIKCPVIFTTAYDQYALQAFKVNSVDYLLKPVKSEELKTALDKYKKRFSDKTSPEIDYSVLLSALSKNKGEYQKRIVIRYGEIIKTVEIADVAYFYTESKINFLYTFKNQRFSVDHNLDELEHILNPKEYFRINRQFIVNIKAIDKMVTVSKSRVKLTLNPPCEIETIVSTERSSYFKDWLTGQ
ncbi:MAG: response regulator transcription factor [Bacteroidetes bacterium]|nr:response regulator transcription factor [Bacteroidota bacterium]